MRHRKKGKKLGRDSGHRKKTLAALSSALIEHKRIQTTLPKAKALRPFVEPLITRAKEDTMHNRKQVFRYLQDKEAIKELFGDVAAQVGDRPGGYTRIIKLGQRAGDGAEMAMIELVDYNDVPPASTGSSGSRTRRGGGKGRRKSSQQTDGTEEAEATEAEATEAEATEAEATEAEADVDATAETEAPEADTDTDETEASEDETSTAAAEATDDSADAVEEDADADEENDKDKT
jgi:large subunit ribosomal protein L17